MKCEIGQALAAIEDELQRAIQKFGPFASAHEGWAVIREEVDELWSEVKANKGYGPTGYQEAVQVAAMALRYIVDVTGVAEAERRPGE